VWNILAADKNRIVNQPSMNWTWSSFPMWLFLHGTICWNSFNIKWDHAEWFFICFKLPKPQLGQDNMVTQNNVGRKICFIYLARITSNYGSSHVTGHWLVFSQCHISDHFLVLFYAPWVSLISF
jgi:hypothetical protein